MKMNKRGNMGNKGKRNKASKFKFSNLNLLLGLFFIFAGVLILGYVIAPLVSETITSTSAQFISNATASVGATNLGLQLNGYLNTTYGYTSTTPNLGGYFSFVFYNSTSTYWSTNLTIVDINNLRNNNPNYQVINLSDPSLLFYHSLDDFNATFARDLTGKYNGTYSGSIRTEQTYGINGMGAKFNRGDSGGRGRIQLPLNNNLDIANHTQFPNATLSLWIRPSRIVALSSVIYGSSTNLQNGAEIIGNNGINYVYFDSSSAVITSNASQALDKWQHIVLTVSGNNLKFYTDGVLTGTGTAGTNNASGAKAYMYGADDSNSDWNYYGVIDEVLLYNNTLNSSQITQLYNIGLSQKANTNITLQTRTATSYNVSDSSLKAFYAFNNDSSLGENSTIFVDLSGKYNATCGVFGVCPTTLNTTNSVVRNAWNFGATNTSIYMQNSTLTKGWTEITISAWVYRTATSSYPIIVGTRNPRGTTCIIGFNSNAADGSTTAFSVCGASTAYGTSATASIPTGKWVFLTGTAKMGNSIQIYENGVLKGNTSLAGGVATINQTNEIHIGQDSTYNNRMFLGQIDEVRIYNRSLSASEVANLYELGSYHFNDWSAWSSESLVTSSVNNIVTTQGNYMQYRANFYSNTTGASPFVTGYNVTGYVNVAPSIASVVLNSTNVSRNDTTTNLTCYANIADANGGNVYANYSWYNNSVAVPSLTGQSSAITAGSLSLISTITPGNFSWNQTWTCNITATYDGLDYNTTSSNSSSLIIADVTSPNATLNTPANNSYFAAGVNATGGTITYVGGYTIHTFTSNGTFSVTSGSGNVEVLVVAGGGGGGYQDCGGGGGAGGLIYNSSYAVSAGSYNVVIGNGGAGGTSSQGGDGQNSSFGSIIATGGGGGGKGNTGANAGRNGGSGGGGGWGGQLNGSGIPGQGYGGGPGNGGGGASTAGGGGGGSSAVGTVMPTPASRGGDGGNGTMYNINGSNVWYAGGGGGGGDNAVGYGGVGGGGSGGYRNGNPTTAVMAGTPNTGGGGGGAGGYSGGNGGAGGSGIVIVRYLTSSTANSVSINLTANLTDNLGIKNATLYVYNQSGLYNSTDVVGYAVGTLTTTVGVVISFVDNVYNWFYKIFDFAGNVFTSGNYTLTIDTIYPLINFTSPTPTNGSGGMSLTINVSLTELNNANITYSWNYTNYIYNISGSNLTSMGSNNYTLNITSLGSNNYNILINQYGLAAGIWYPYNVSVLDLANNFNTTETRWVTGNTAPVLNFTLPTTFTGNYSRNEIIVNLTAIDNEANMDTAILKLYNSSRSVINTTSSSSSSSVNIYLNYSNLTDGIYYFNATANDSAGVIGNTSTEKIVLDTANPGIIFNFPANNIYSNISSINISVNITDNLGIANITLFVYNSSILVNQTNSFFASDILSSQTGISVNLTDNNYTWFYKVYDWPGNLNMTGNRTFIVDTTYPSISYGTNIASDYSNLSQANVYVNVSFTEINFANITFSLYNATSVVNSTTFAIQTYEINWTNLPVLNYSYQVNITDLANNKNATRIYHIWVDNIAPNATLNTPANNTYTNITSQNLTANLSDVGVGIKNATLYVYNQSGLFNSTVVNFASNTLLTTTGVVINFIDNVYNWFYQLFDWAGNQFVTGNRTLTIDTVKPTIYNVIYSPNTNDSIDPGINITFNATIVDATSGVQTAILEVYNGTTWQNYTMSLISGGTIYNGTYNASITIVASEQNYTFNVWANDTTGNANQSINQTFKSSWDCTWNIAITPGTDYNFDSVGGFYEERTIGNITITNTGDVQYSNNNCSIKFARTSSGSNWYDGSLGYDDDGQYLNFSQTYYLKSGAKGLRYYVNGSQILSLIVNATENKTITLKGLFTKVTTAINEYPSFVIASNIIDTESLLSNITIGIKNPGMVITPGAYLETGLDPSSQTVYLTAGNFSIAGYVKNLVDVGSNPQNNTAHNVSLNVSVPSALSSILSSGNLNKTMAVMNNTNKNYTNLTFTLTSSNIVNLGVQSYTFTSYAYGYENSTGNLSLIQYSGNITTINGTGIVSFVCYSAAIDSVCPTACTYLQNITNYYDPDCTAPATTTTGTSSSGGGGGGGGGGAATPKLEKSEATFELLRGKEQEFDFEINNKYNDEMKDIKISVTGLNSEYMSINPTTIESIAPKDSKTIKVKINAPAYFTGRKYTLIFEINSKLMINGSSANSVIEKKAVTLYIVEVTRIDSENMLNDSRRMLEEMNESSMVLKDVGALLNEHEKAFNEVDFTKAKELYEQLKQIYDNAMESKKTIEQLKKDIAEAEHNGIKTIETKKMLYLAETAYARGDYSLAIERLKEAKLTYALEVKGEFNLAYAVKNNPLQSLALLIGAGLFGLGGTLFGRFYLYRKKLKILKDEEVLLLQLMKLMQKECFENNKMSMEEYLSMEEYQNAMAQYENRLSETIEEKIRVETKLANILKMKGKKLALSEEKKRLVEMIKKIQDDYLNKGKIETRVYENMMKSYTSRLSEVEEEIANLEAIEALSRQKSKIKLFGNKT